MKNTKEKPEADQLTKEDILKLDHVFTLARKAEYANEKSIAELINFKRALFQKLAPIVTK